MPHATRDSLITRVAIVALFLSGPVLVFWVAHNVLGLALWLSVLIALVGGTAGCTVVALVLLAIVGGGWAVGDLFRKDEKPSDP